MARRFSRMEPTPTVISAPTPRRSRIPKNRPRPIRIGLKTHHHERFARPQEAPARPATFRTRSTAKARPRKDTLTDEVAELFESVIFWFLCFRRRLLRE